jgi:ABC-type multidrug transport system permease subunit
VLAARTAAQGILIPLAFISDVFIVGADLPRALSVIGSALPLKHFADAAADTFQPGGGTGYSPAHLAVLAAWTVVGASVAWWRFGWAPRGFATGHAQPAEDNTPVNRHGLTPATEPGRPATVALLRSQTAYALRSLYRDPLATFFSVIFPAVILILFPSVFGDATVRGLSMAQYLLPAMAGYAIAVAAYVTLPESVADARAQGVLRRLRGTPLPFRWYLAGRILSAIAVGLISCTLLVLVAVLGLGVRFAPAALPAFLLAVLLGAACFAGLGLAVVALLPAARSVVPVTLGTLLPLSFVSGTFVVGAAPLPSWLDRIGEFFPLRHLTEALLAATRPDTTEFAWPHLALVALWTVAAFGLAWLRRDALTGSAADSLPRRKNPSLTTSQGAR